MKDWLIIAFTVALSAGAAGAQEIPRPEHPRPDRFRPAWQNLNGVWEFQADPQGLGERRKWHQQLDFPERIRVPYPIESELSGLARANPPELNWYRLRFQPAPTMLAAPRQLLHFGAADYRATVWLNGKKLGEHVGGYSPFSFEVTGLLQPGDNLLAVRVFDSRSRSQVRGKQTWKKNPYGILYTAVTGIWQTVWLEGVGRSYLENFQVDFDPQNHQVRIRGQVKGADQNLLLQAEVKAEENASAEVHGPAAVLPPGLAEIAWTEPAPRLWSPDSPHLYQLALVLQDSEGAVLDRVESYFGLRAIEVRDGKIYLNGRELYQKLLLDQGYFPGGWYAAASDEELRRDVELYKAMGFNGLRKHQKVEDPRFLYWCDRLGFLVWEEMPSLNHWLIRWNRREAKARFEREWEDVIRRDYNHPSIVVWTLYNENWGLLEAVYRPSTMPWARAIVQHTRAIGGNRLVVDNSGGWHFDTDIFDFHQYLPTAEKTRELYQVYTTLQPGEKWPFRKSLGLYRRGLFSFPPLWSGERYQGRPLLLSEYGGFGFYRSEAKSLLDNFREYTEVIGEFPRLVGYCYTQPYDVEQEQNGLMTFDRRPKLPIEDIRAVNEKVGSR